MRKRVVQVPAKAPAKAPAPVDKHDHVLAVAMDPQAVLKTLQLVQAMDADESLHGIGWARVKYFIRSYASTMS